MSGVDVFGNLRRTKRKSSNRSYFPPARDGMPCTYCGRALSPWNTTRDHIVPLSRGGYDGSGNVVWCCLLCNASKADKRLADWSAPNARIRGIVIASLRDGAGLIGAAREIRSRGMPCGWMRFAVYLRAVLHEIGVEVFDDGWVEYLTQTPAKESATM